MSNQKEIEIIPIYYDYILTKNYPVNILVGGRNSGKSYFMEQMSVINMHNNDKYKLLVIEDVETNIGAGVKNGIEARIEDFEYDSIFKSVKQPAEVTHKITGSTAIFKGYHSKEQQKQVKSLNEVTAVWYEEAENITYEQFKALRMQLRGGYGENRQLFLTLNPINEGGFINQYFFQGEPDKVYERFADGRPKVFEKKIKVELESDGNVDIIEITCMIVVSVHWDNPYLTAEQRADIEELKYTNMDMYKMLAEGKFVKGQGAYFPEFEKYIHVKESYPLPKDWQRYRVFDYGLDKLACYWIAMDNYNKAYVYKELYGSELLVSDGAEKILEMTMPDEIIYKTIAPPDMWNRHKDTGRSTAQIYQEHGIYLSQADNAFEQGCLDLKEWLKPYDSKNEQTGEPIKTANMVIFDCCPNLINSLNSIQKDERNPNVYAKQPHELTHSIDAIRYFVAGRPAPKIIKTSKNNNLWMFQSQQQQRSDLDIW